GVNNFNVHALDELNDTIEFPVFLRVADDHGGPLTDLIDDRATLRKAIDALVELGYPPSALIAVEFAAEPVRPGIFRKLSVFRVGERFLPHPSVHDISWVIKEGRAGVAPKELYDEDLRFMQTNPFAEQIRRVFEIANVDYGRVDFGLVDGRPRIYEVNTNPVIGDPTQHSIPERVESMKLWWEGLLSALHAIDLREEAHAPIDMSLEDAATLGRALETYPSVKNGALKLGEALAQRGEREAAARHAIAALAQSPDDALVAIRASRLLVDCGFVAEGIEALNRALDSNPGNYELLLEAAQLLARAQRGDEAIEAMNRALALRPDEPDTYEVLYGVHLSLGDRAAAIEATKSTLKLLGADEAPSKVRRRKHIRARLRLLKVGLDPQQIQSFFRQVTKRISGRRFSEARTEQPLGR
ncbi:MAG: tetratricopeptide repeat protein, partial [Planctomycetota bacterium]